MEKVRCAISQRVTDPIGARPSKLCAYNEFKEVRTKSKIIGIGQVNTSRYAIPAITAPLTPLMSLSNYRRSTVKGVHAEDSFLNMIKFRIDTS